MKKTIDGHELDISPLPPQIAEALVSLGLRTEAGVALMAGYRLGNAELHPDNGELRVVLAEVGVVLIPREKT